MKILILGAGAMGSLFSGKLKQNGMDVTLFNRMNDHIRKIKEEGLQIIEKDGTCSKVSIPVATESIDLVESYNLVVVLVKSFATEEVIKKVLHIVHPDTMILTLQNGIGNIETIGRFISHSQISTGSTNTGAGIIEPGLIAHRGWGKTFIGSSLSGTNSNILHEIASIFTKSGLYTEVVPDAQSIVWSKLMINVAINGLTAVTRLTNGDAVSTNEGKEIVRRLIAEAVQIAHAEDIRLLYDNPADECIRIGSEQAGVNKSSMLTDVFFRRKTEIESINGAIVELGKKHAIPTPYNEMMTNLVKVIESSYSKLVTNM